MGCATEKTAPVSSSGKAAAPAVEKVTTPPTQEKTIPSTTPTVIAPEETKKTSETKPAVTVAAGTMEVLGSKGFNPMTTTIKKGESLTFVNKNPSAIDSNKNAVLVFQNKNTGVVVNSHNQINYEGKYVHTFKEAGEYKVWDVGYGVMATVKVE